MKGQCPDLQVPHLLVFLPGGPGWARGWPSIAQPTHLPYLASQAALCTSVLV